MEALDKKDMLLMNESKKYKRKALINEFRERASKIPVKETKGNRLDNGDSGGFTILWKWLEEELVKLDAQE